MSRLSKNISYNLVGQGLGVILSILSVKYIHNRLGDDVLGLIYFTATINTLMSVIVSAGIASTTVREVSSYWESEPEYVKKLIATYSLLYWLGFLLVAGIVYLLAPVFVENWIILESLDRQSAVLILRVLGISSLLVLPEALYTSLFRGLQRMEITNLVSVIGIALQQVGIILILVITVDLEMVIFWMAFCYLLRVITYQILTGKYFSPNSLLPSFHHSVFTRTKTFAKKMMALSILSTLYVQADRLIISKLLPIGAVGYYSFAFGNIAKARLFTQAVSQAAYPALSQLIKNDKPHALMAQYRKLQDLVSYGLAPFFALILFAAYPLCTFIFDKDVANLLLFPIMLLCIAFFMNGTLTIPHIFSVAYGRPEISAKQNLYALIFIVPVTGILIYKLGLLGASLSWVLYHMFAYFYGLPRICRECLHIPSMQWYTDVGRVIFLILSTYGVAWSIVIIGGEYSIVYFSVTYALGSLCYVSAAYFLVSLELRETFLKMIKRLRTRIGEAF